MNWKKLFRFKLEKINKFEDRSIDLSVVPQAEPFELDEIATRKGLEIYKKMRLDDQVRACSDLKKSLLVSSGWKIDGSDKEQVEFVKENIRILPKSLSKKIKNILTAFDYGFSVTEIVWFRKDGKIYSKNIKTHSPFNIDFQFDDYGNIIGVNIGGNTYKPDKFIIYSFSDEFDNPYGNSDLKSAYSPYFFKQIVWRFWASHLEGFGSPLKLGKIPASASKEEKEAFENIVKNIHFRTGILLPRSEISKEEFSIELLESKREGGSQFKDAITNADERIARALLFPRLFGMTGEKFGSYALGKAQFDVVYSLLEELQKEVAEELTKQYIQKLLVYNYSNADTSVRLEFLPPNKELVKDLITMYKELIKDGILDKSEENVNKIKNYLGTTL